MAEIPHAYVEQTTAQTHTGDTNWTDISGAAIASGNFIVGRKYLIVVTSQFGVTNPAGNAATRVLHGSTAFDESESVIDTVGGSELYIYGWFTIWTAVDSEGIKLQHKVINAGEVVKSDTITIHAIELSEELEEDVDWFFDESIADTALTTSWSSSNNATKTFTPAGSSNWLVLCRGRIIISTIDNQSETRLERSGESSSTTPLRSREGEDATNDSILQSMLRVFPLTAVSNTFTSQSRNDAATANTRKSSAIFCLNLSKFADKESAYTDGAITLSAADYGAEVQTLSITPTATGDFWTLGDATLYGPASRELKMRMQIGNVDQPGGVTAAAEAMYTTFDASDRGGGFLQTVDSLSSESAVDLDGSDLYVQADAQHRQLMSISMELAVGGGGGGGGDYVPKSRGSRIPSVHRRADISASVRTIGPRGESGR